MIDYAFYSVAGSIDNDNKDEDASNKDISPFLGRGIGHKESLPLDSLVEEIVEDDDENEGNKTEKD